MPTSVVILLCRTIPTDWNYFLFSKLFVVVLMSVLNWHFLLLMELFHSTFDNSVLCFRTFQDDSSQRITGNIFTDIVEPIDNPDPTNHHITPENSFLLMLRHGILALQLLPENSAARKLTRVLLNIWDDSAALCWMSREVKVVLFSQ